AEFALGPATELLAPLLRTRAELESLLSSIDLSGCTAQVSQQFKQELGMLIGKQRPRHMQFYAPLFNKDSILSYLPRDTLLVLDEPRSIKQAVGKLDTEANELRAQRLELGELPPNFPSSYFIWEEMESLMENKQRLILTAWGASDSEQAYRLNFTPAPNYAGQLLRFINKVKQMLSQKQRLILASHQASRLSELLDEEGILTLPVAEIKETPPPGSLTLVQGSLAEGWVMNDDTHLFTDAEIFGFVKERRVIRKRPVPRHKLFVDITP
ncbi:unnamed protein product, partial [marine sediment metagenome]